MKKSRIAPFKRLRLLAVPAALMLLVACSQPAAAPDIWTGETTNTVSGAVQPLRLEVQASSGRWLGAYFVDAARGTFDGSLSSDGTLAAVLTPSGNCSFDLTGVVSGDTLTASFLPTDCPGGAAGTWLLSRQ